MKMLLSSVLFILSIDYTCGTLSSLYCNPAKITWEGGSFCFPSSEAKRMYTSTGQYIPKNIIATKAAVLFDTIILLTSRYKSGNPASLVSYDMKLKMKEPKFTPYPSLFEHEEGNCDAIQNAVDFYVDHLGLLWVLDTGILDEMVSPQCTCPPKAVCISLKTGKIVKKIDLSEFIGANSRLQFIIADYDCEKRPYLYITDAPSRSLLVFDVEKSSGFKVNLPTTVADYKQPTDTMYMALTRLVTTKSHLYLSYLNSPFIFSINTDYLKKGITQGKIHVVGTKVAPTVFLGTDGACSIYFRYKNERSIYAWDTSTPFLPESLHPVYTSEECFLPTAVTFDQLRSKMKVLESNFQDYISDSCGIGATHQLLDMSS